MTVAPAVAASILLSAAFVLSAEAGTAKISARLVAPLVFPVMLEPGERLPKFVVLVNNPTPVAREVLVEAFAVAEDKTLLKRYSLSANVGGKESALLKTTLEPCHAGFTEAACSIGAIQVRAYSGERVDQPRPLPKWLQLGDTNLASSLDSFGKGQAEASVVVTNSSSRDAHVYLRFRLYDRTGLQVVVCNNERSPIFSDSNLLVPAGLSVRLGCSASPFEDTADTPAKVRVELLGYEQRQE
jgi:hypothetical protein